ncbi:hypothetical protein FQA39_LY02054 [Lamprigera yunnana]|nr:hypothetical protein FQA39_LY02054 [Lamprigera yunnana]
MEGHLFGLFTTCLMLLEFEIVDAGQVIRDYFLHTTFIIEQVPHFVKLININDKKGNKITDEDESSKPVAIALVQRPDVADHDFIKEQEKLLYALCACTMALPVGRGMFTLWTATPVVTEPSPMPIAIVKTGIHVTSGGKQGKIFSNKLNIILNEKNVYRGRVYMVASPESVVMPINDETVLTCEMNLLPDKFQWKHYPLGIQDASNPKIPIILGNAHFVDLPATMFTSDKKVSTIKIKSSSKSVAGDYQCLAHYGASVVASIPGRITITTLGKFTPQNSIQVNVVVGNTLLWRCDFLHSNPPAYIDYYKNGAYVSPEVPVGTQSLIIPNLSTSHSGKYECTARNIIEQSSSNADFNLNLKVVNGGPIQSPRFIIPPKKFYTVNAGESVFLECSAVGNPVPKVFWFKSNGQLPQNRTQLLPGGLQILEVKSTDDGVYICNYTNSAGTISHHITLVFNEAPSTEEGAKSTDIKEGENLDLECKVNGTPEPQISWFLNGESVLNDTQIEAIGNRIYFRPVEKKHAGTLQCFATNTVGTDYSSFNLKVIPKQISSTDILEEYLTPRPIVAIHKRRKHHKTKKNRGQKGTTEMIPPSRPTITRLNDESVMVRWTVPENNGLPIQFFKVQYRELGPINHNGTHKSSKWKTTNADIPPHIRSYEVNNLNPDHTYKFRIAAVYSNNDNKLGPNSVKFHLNRADFFLRNPLPVPRLIHTEMINETAIRIHWEEVSSVNVSIDGFFIHYVPADSASDYTKTTVEGGEVTSFIIRHLQPGTMYDIKMQSFTTKSASEFSPIMKQNTAFATKKQPIKESSIVVPATTVETPPETTSDSQTYIFIGAGVLGVALLLSLIVLIIMFKKRKQKKNNLSEASQADKDDANHHIQADSNEYVVSPKTVSRIKNGNVSSNNRITITPNPLADADNKNNNCSQPSSSAQESLSSDLPSKSKMKDRDKDKTKRTKFNLETPRSGENYV